MTCESIMCPNTTCSQESAIIREGECCPTCPSEKEQAGLLSTGNSKSFTIIIFIVNHTLL